MRNLIVTSIVVLACACGEPGTGGTGGGSGGGGGAGGGSSGSTCTTATLFAGNPLHDEPMLRPADGTGLLQDPPLLYRQVVFSNGQLITHVGQELWRASLSDKILHKVAGTEGNQALITGPCAQARFANIFHIAVASDGSLFVSDQTANAILKVTDPLGAGCTVARWAGAAMDYAGPINSNNPPNVGDVDGPGAMAKFSLPERMALDSSDNIYVWDEGNNAIRKIANDADHTVSTLVDAIATGNVAVLSQTFMGGKVYVWGTEGNDVFLNSYDAAAGTKAVLLKGRADLFGGASGDSKTLGTITNDGSSLIVFFSGQLFRIDTAGKISAPLAGVYKPGLFFSSGYDPKASQPADKVQLLALSQGATAGLNAWITRDENGDIFVSNRADNAYVEKIECP